MNFSKAQITIYKTLWEKDLALLPMWQVFSIKLLRICYAVMRDLYDGLPTLRAMGLVYTTLLSLVPFLAVGFAVLKAVGVHNQIKPMLQTALAPLGEQGNEITAYIIGSVDNIDVGILGIMGTVFLLYTVISLIRKIESAINYTWRITEYRGIAQRIGDYLSLLLVGPALVISSIVITAVFTSSSIVAALYLIEPFGFIIREMGNALPYLLIITAFTFIYIFIPNAKVRFRSALLGAVVAGLMWQTAGILFASFVAGSANYTAVYSSFAILIIFMIWLYLSWLILLIGASISFYHQHPETISPRHQVLNLSGRLREKVALIIMCQIGKNFHHKNKPCASEQLFSELDISTQALTPIINSLIKSNLIIRSKDKEVSYLPGQPLEQISISSILSSVRAAGESPKLNIYNVESEESIDRLIKNIDESVTSGLNSKSLHGLIIDNG